MGYQPWAKSSPIHFVLMMMGQGKIILCHVQIMHTLNHFNNLFFVLITAGENNFAGGILRGSS